MIKHIVMFKLKQRTPENLDQAVTCLRRLEGAIDTLRGLEIGVDFKQRDRSYDVVLTAQFDDEAGLDAYAAHPAHQPVIEEMGALCQAAASVDYEI